jgi:hypothetical protein
MPTRAPSKQSAPAEIINGLSLGYNGYTDPTQTKPQMWAPGTVNLFSGAFQNIQRARFANVYTQNPTTNQPYTSLKYFALPAVGAWLMADQNGKLYSHDTSSSYAQTQRLNPYVDPAGSGTSLLAGPWSRESLQNILYEMNGQVKQAGRNANAATIEGWGLDAPDNSLQITVNSGASAALVSIQRQNNIVTASTATLPAPFVSGGTTFVNISGVSDSSFNGVFAAAVSGAGPFSFVWSQVGQNTSAILASGTLSSQITKAVGRSYTYAWENANKGHVGPPAPVTQYILYNGQYGKLDIQEPGTISTTSGSPTVTGTGTFFTSAWVGRSIYFVSGGVAYNFRVVGVSSSTSMVVNPTVGINSSGNIFMVYDPQATHIRFYATADGGATYFRTGRAAFNPQAVPFTSSGLEQFDTANSEPPNFPFTTEVAQTNNVPPPIGSFVNEYQGVLTVYGVPGALQTFFYSNQTATSVGLLQESFAPLNQITLPLANAQINGMLEFPGSLIIWSDKQDMFRLTGLLTDNTVTGVASGTASAQQGAQVARLPYMIGCASPFAAEITPLGGFWLSTNKEIWLYTDRYAPRNIGRPVQDILNTIASTSISLARMKYFHANNRNWLVLAIPANSGTYNNTLLILDLDLLASNGSPSYFTFDMATNSPSWYVYQPGTMISGVWVNRCDSLEAVFETGGLVRILTGQIDLIQDVDYTGGSGTEIGVPNGILALHAYGNDSAVAIKRPTWIRFNTNRDPAILSEETSIQITAIARSGGIVTVTTNGSHNLQVSAFPDTVFIQNVTDSSYNGVFQVASVPSNNTFTYMQSGANSTSSSGVVIAGWIFQAQGIDDDFYTFNNPLQLFLTPGVNDSSALCGNPDLSGGSAFRHSPELFRVGSVNFVMGRRLKFLVNFPSGTGQTYQLRGIQLGFGVQPPS